MIPLLTIECIFDRILENYYLGGVLKRVHLFDGFCCLSGFKLGYETTVDFFEQESAA